MPGSLIWQCRAPRWRARLAISVAISAALGMPPAAAADTWDNSSGNQRWNTATNWLDDTEPTISDDVIFNEGFPGLDNALLAGEVARSLTFNASFALRRAFVIGTPTLTLGNGDITVASGKFASVETNLTSSALLQKYGLGALTLTRPVTLTGQSGIWIRQGTVTLDGASLTSDSSIMGIDGFCTANVTGAGALWSNPNGLDMGVNTNGSSTLNITAGGTVTLGDHLGGGNTLANTTLTLDGGTLDMQGHRIGNSGTFAAFIDVRNFRSGTLKNVQEINNGTVPLIKTTSGTLILDGENTYTGGTTVSGGTLQLGAGETTGSILGDVSISGGATLAFNRSNSVSFNDVISGAGALSKLASGTLTLRGENTYSGVTTISAGTLQVGAFGATGRFGTGSVVNNGAIVFSRSTPLAVPNNISGTGAVSQAGDGATTLSGVLTYTGATNVLGGTLILGTNLVSSASLTIALVGSAELASDGTHQRVIKTGALTVSEQGRLDLKDNKLIVSAGDVGSWNGSAYTGVAGLIDAGRGNASNAQWNGSGVVTTDIRAVNNNDLCSIGIAIASQAKNLAATATTTFAGQTVLGSDVIAMFTWGGDANLDGKINIDDYGRIDGNVAQSGSVFGWFNGDFNYDGKINIDDYGIIDGNINQQGAAFPAAEGVSAVPEPSAMAAVALSMRLRRRRRR